MKKPNFAKCTEEELWKYVGFHLAKEGIEAVLVGGAVVSVYSKGAYHSGDLDLVTQSGLHEKIQSVLESIGFQKIRGRHFEHPECSHLIVEFPPGPVSIGDDYHIQPDSLSVEGQRLKILSPTDCIRDRLASYIHFKARECLDQAVLVAKRQPIDLEKIRKWCKDEGAEGAFEDFRVRVKAKR